jgi:hypothetical protein
MVRQINLRNRFFRSNEYLEEFDDFLRNVVWSDRNPLNTEMLFLWSMIRSTKPKLFIESGTFKGYSANFICEALQRNDNGAEFITYGFNPENCLPFARKRLEKYPFAKVIEGDSRELLKTWQQEMRSTAFFIDGPKGRNLPPLLFTISKNFPKIPFIAVHDCQKESGSHNRTIVLDFFGGEYPIMFCDSGFQDKYSYLDEPLIGKSELVDWKPYYWNGIKQDSYGTGTGYIVPALGKVGTPANRWLLYLRRHLKFRVHRWLTLKKSEIVERRCRE